MPVAVLLVALVVLAAGIGGTSNFTGARWFPKSRWSPAVRTGTTMVPVTVTGGGQQVQSGKGTVPAWLIVTAVVLGAIALTVFVWRWWRGGRLLAATELARPCLQVTIQQVVENDPEPEPEPEKLLTGIELALEVLDQGREPADAVVRAWLGLQETAEESGIVRRAAETPTEFTSRILSRAFVDDGAVRTLLRLYLRTRFGDHPVTAQDVADVREALQQLVSSWQPTAGASAASAGR
jgi:Domain of unknown function (DUF4129)